MAKINKHLGKPPDSDETADYLNVQEIPATDTLLVKRRSKTRAKTTRVLGGKKERWDGVPSEKFGELKKSAVALLEEASEIMEGKGHTDAKKECEQVIQALEKGEFEPFWQYWAKLDGLIMGDEEGTSFPRQYNFFKSRWTEFDRVASELWSQVLKLTED
jgi:hypothetical protein